MIHHDLLTEEEQVRLYLIHHMHHYPKKTEVIHELHHCFLFLKPNMKGNKFSVEHLYIKGSLYHIIKRKTPVILYDHANNKFNIETKKIDGNIYSIVA